MASRSHNILRNTVYKTKPAGNINETYAWRPDAVPQCYHWWDAARNVSLISGTQVLAWTDVVNGLTLLTTLSGTNRPVYNPVGLNGFPDIAFTAGNKYLQADNIGPKLAKSLQEQTWTVIVVAKLTDAVSTADGVFAIVGDSENITISASPTQGRITCISSAPGETQRSAGFTGVSDITDYGCIIMHMTPDLLFIQRNDLNDDHNPVQAGGFYTENSLIKLAQIGLVGDVNIADVAIFGRRLKDEEIAKLKDEYYAIRFGI